MNNQISSSLLLLVTLLNYKYYLYRMARKFNVEFNLMIFTPNCKIKSASERLPRGIILSN